MALFLECFIADCQRFINDQDIWVDTGLNSKGEPYGHATGVRPHRPFDKATDIGKAKNRIEPLVDLLLTEPENRPVEINILQSCEFRIEAAAQLQQSADAPSHFYAAAAGLEGAADQLQERAFPRTIASNNPDSLSLEHLKAERLERPDFILLTILTAEQTIEEAVCRSPVETLSLLDATHMNGNLPASLSRRLQAGGCQIGFHQSTSAKPRLAF